jgi:5-methylcytosine-specific restriction endonuclease McrA
MNDDQMRTCLRDPIPEIAIATRYVNEAVTAHLDGDRAEAVRLLKAADMPAIRAWSASIMGKYSEYNRPTVDPGAPPIVARDLRAKPRRPSEAMKRDLLARYRYQCCFCGTPVIRSAVRIRLISLYPDLLRWKDTNFTDNAILKVMDAQYDHAVPHARGGQTALDNLMIACGPCNYGRGGCTFGEMRLLDPRTRASIQSDWDGLERLLSESIGKHVSFTVH